MAGERARAPVSLQPAASLIPDGLADLEGRAEAEGIGIVARVLDRWANGSERYDRPGEALLAAVTSDAAAPFWESMGFEPIDQPGITHVFARP